MSMLKEFIHMEHPWKKLKSNESGKCAILPDLADILTLLLELLIVEQIKAIDNLLRDFFYFHKYALVMK